MAKPLLEVQDLHVDLAAADGARLPALRGVSLRIEAGRSLALVGESGCGKSLTCLALMGLLPRQAQVRGQVLFQGRDLLRLPLPQLDALRGGAIAMVFQDPSNALNPVHSVGAQITEALGLHRGLRGEAARAEAVRLLERVGVGQARQRLSSYPHQLSGGLNQRVMIAMALAGEPQLLIADEPTTALDVTVQAQILALLRDLQAETGMALLLVTHDLGVVAEMADEVAVMYAGRMAELASASALFTRPAHPYSAALLASLPRLEGQGQAPLPSIEGSVPPLHALPRGCAFAPRCAHVQARCLAEQPAPPKPKAPASCFYPNA